MFRSVSSNYVCWPLSVLYNVKQVRSQTSENPLLFSLSINQKSFFQDFCFMFGRTKFVP